MTQPVDETIYESFSDEPQQDKGELFTGQPVEVDLTDPPKDGEGEPSRKEKKNLRAVEHQKGELEGQLADMQRQIAESNARYQMLASQVLAQPQKPQADPYEMRIEKLQDEAKQNREAFQHAYRASGEKGLDPAEQEKFHRRAADIDGEIAELRGERAARRVLHFNQQRGGGTTPEQAAIVERLKFEYPEVMGNPQAVEHAVYSYRARLATGAKDDWGTVKEVMAGTQATFGMKAPPVSDSTRRRFMGHGNGGSGQGGQSPTRVSLNKDQQEMALAAFPHLSERDALKEWAKRMEKKRQSRSG